MFNQMKYEIQDDVTESGKKGTFATEMPCNEVEGTTENNIVFVKCPVPITTFFWKFYPYREGTNRFFLVFPSFRWYASSRL